MKKKKKLIILITVVLSMLTVGCSNKADEINQQYENAMSEGKSKVIEEEYDKAIDYFELALESKKEDTEAMNLIEQLNLLIEAEKFEVDGAYFYQIEQLEKIAAIDTETNVVKDKASEYKEEVIKNIDASISDIENNIEDGKYTKSKEDLEGIIEECKKIDSLKEQLDRCNKLLDTCKEKKKEAEAQAKKQTQQKQVSSNSNDSNGSIKKSSSNNNKVYCSTGNHYVDKENFIEGFNRCKGCEASRELFSTYTYLDCDICGESCAVSQYTGKCQYCGEKVLPAVKKIYDDGTVILEDGSTW